jgi:hypothetical protein
LVKGFRPPAEHNDGNAALGDFQIPRTGSSDKEGGSAAPHGSKPHGPRGKSSLLPLTLRGRAMPRSALRTDIADRACGAWPRFAGRW